MGLTISGQISVCICLTIQPHVGLEVLVNAVTLQEAVLQAVSTGQKKKKKNHVLFCPHIIKHISTTTQHQVKKKIKTTFKSFHCHRLPSIQTKDKGPTEQGACWPVQVHSAQNEVLDSLKKQLQTVLRREGCPGCTVLGGYSVVHGSHTALRVRTLAFIYPGIFCLAPSCL